VRRIPVEAEYEDLDRVTVHVLLHVIDGRLNEIEVYREDSAAVGRAATSVDDLRVMVW
jgi:hypothetical protein